MRDGEKKRPDGKWALENWPSADPIVRLFDHFETTCLGWQGGPEKNPNWISARAGEMYAAIKALIESQRIAAIPESAVRQQAMKECWRIVRPADCDKGQPPEVLRERNLLAAAILALACLDGPIPSSPAPAPADKEG